MLRQALRFEKSFMKKMIMVFIFLSSFGVLISAPAAANLLVLQVGMEAAQPSLATLEGKPQKFAELQGEKLTVLVFWSSWIRKSEAALARMQKLYAQYSSLGLSVVGINVEERNASPLTQDKVKQTRDKLKLQFPMLVDPGLLTFRDYGVMALPTTVILDKNRVVKYELAGYPLVGAETMADYISAAMTGSKPVRAVTKPQYQPNKSAISFYNMGTTTLKTKSLSGKSEASFKKAVEADPGFILPHLSLARIYSGRGESGAAQAEYQAVLAKEPQHPVALCELAMLLVNQGKSGEGLALLDAARKSAESYAPCFYYTGYALGLEGKLAEAGKMFEDAEKLDPSDYRVFIYQGKLFEQQKNLKRAAEEYGRALENVIHAP